MLASSSKPTRRLARVLAELSTQSASAESFEAALLKLALPSGSLQDATVDLFSRANFEIEFKSRDYFPDINDPELGLISFRAQEVSRYVEAGVADCGITGRDWVVENGNAVRASPVHLQPNTPSHSALAPPPVSQPLNLLLAGLPCAAHIRCERRRQGSGGVRAHVQ
jgi:hypothetical protein